MSKIEETIQKLHQASYYENASESDQARKENFPAYLTEVLSQKDLISLPILDVFQPNDNDLVNVLNKRRSVRHYDTQASMTLEELTYLLKFTQGVRELSEKRGITFRYVPSAGSRHPFETFLLVQRVESLQPGIYHFVAHQNALELVSSDPQVIESAHISTLKQRQVITSAVTFFWSAEVYRTSWRYGERAYRYINLDAGHVCQNLYLCAESIDYGVCAIAAFDDRLANQLFGLDDQSHFIAYIASVGKKLDS